MIRVCAIGLMILGFVALAAADEYWIAYEGNDFPENVGWRRVFGDENGPQQGGAVRRIENGVLILDSLRHNQIFDFYDVERQIDPDPGEVFLMQWRLQIDKVVGRYDPTVGVFSDESWVVGFEFSENSIRSLFERPLQATFEPGVFHDFEFRSDDMRTYRLEIDGKLALEGDFSHVASSSRVGWGDGIQGAASFSRWDYFRFGVVPEPSTGTMWMLILFHLRTWRFVQ